MLWCIPNGEKKLQDSRAQNRAWISVLRPLYRPPIVGGKRKSEGAPTHFAQWKTRHMSFCGNTPVVYAKEYIQPVLARSKPKMIGTRWCHDLCQLRSNTRTSLKLLIVGFVGIRHQASHELLLHHARYVESYHRFLDHYKRASQTSWSDPLRYNVVSEALTRVYKGIHSPSTTRSNMNHRHSMMS